MHTTTAEEKFTHFRFSELKKIAPRNKNYPEYTRCQKKKN